MSLNQLFSVYFIPRYSLTESEKSKGFVGNCKQVDTLNVLNHGMTGSIDHNFISSVGFFSKIYHFCNMLVTSVFKKVYLLISSVLFLDTWLLQTSSSDVQQGRRKRKFLLFLLVLLPFLLFGGK